MVENNALAGLGSDIYLHVFKGGCRGLSRILPLVISILLVLVPLIRTGAFAREGNNTITIAELLEDRDADGRPDRLGEKVTVRGHATVGSGVFDDQYMILYVQDHTAGIMVFSDTLDTAVSRGDSLKVTGTLEIHNSKPEIVVEDLVVVERNSRVPAPVSIDRVFKDPNRFRGQLVSGEAIVQKGNFGKSRKMVQIAPLSGSNDSLYIFVSRSNVHYGDFQFDALEAGDRIHVRGVLIRYISGYSGKTLFQVLPRMREDLTIKGLRPMMKDHSFIYADIDTASGMIYVLLENGLWGYDLSSDSWRFLDALDGFEHDFSNYEFGFNPRAGVIQLWSRGIGELYTIDPKTYRIRRTDRSFDHRNQFGHFPFYRDSTLYAFGGYGFWEWHNIMVFYNRTLNEWSIQDVDTNSPLPGERVPTTGTFVEANDQLYIFGGGGTQSDHPDDQNAVRQAYRDIWRFSFDKQKWKRIMTLDQPENMSTGAMLPSRVGKINKKSSSFYLPGEEMWFIPTYNSKQLDNTFYLRPVHLPSQYAKPAIPLDFGLSSEFIPTNYLYNPNTEKVFFVGIHNLANSDTYPVRIVRMPSDSLTARAGDIPFYASISPLYYLAGVAAIGAFLFWYLGYAKNEEEEEEAGLKSLATMLEASWLNRKEKRLMKYMHEQNRYMDSHEIEELLWSDVESYDYRRRLRNDTLKSINRKFKKRHPSEDSLILRKKDPDDNRRYLYGLNEGLLKE